MQQAGERMKSYVVRGAVTLGAIVLSQLAMMGVAHAAIRTWTGGGVNTNFSTAANWGGTAPAAADDLIFPATSANISAVNDLVAGTAFASITMNGTPAAYHFVNVSGNAFQVTSVTANTTTIGSQLDIANDVTFGLLSTITASGTGSINFSGGMAFPNDITISVATGDTVFMGVMTGSGNITKGGTGTLSFYSASPAYTGAITANGGTVYSSDAAGLGAVSGGTTINAGADIYFGSCGTSNFTIAENLNLNGASSLTSGDNPLPKLAAYNKVACVGGAGGNSDQNFGNTMGSGNVTLSGAIVLGSNVTFGGLATATSLTGALSGAFTITQVPGWGGSLIVNGSSNTTTTPNGTVAPVVFSKTIADAVPANSVSIADNSVIVLNGTRGAVTVVGGTLKGTGTVGTLDMLTGKIAPGLSPGCINSGNLTFSGGSLDEEIGGTTACTGYDQIKVTGTVALGAATTLNIFPYGGFTPAAGNAFTIIDNDGADAVTGTFQGIAEGGTVTVGGVVYKISYVGGTGNDVVATVQAVPAAPKAGFGLRLQDPLAMLVATLLIASSLIMFAYRQFKSR